MRDHREQDIATTDRNDIIQMVKQFKDDGFRLGQMCGTRKENGTEVMYSFDKEGDLKNIVMFVNDGDEVQSITEMYWPAFIYENEIHDLFGVKFKESRLDYEGRFFRLAQPTPWKKITKKEAE